MEDYREFEYGKQLAPNTCPSKISMDHPEIL
jgi:hypothetical protein